MVRAYRWHMPKHPVEQPDWIDTAPITVTESVDIAASPAVVWSLVADHASWPEWFTALDRVEPLGAPTGVGGGRRVIAGRVRIDEEFTAWDEEEHFAFSVVHSGIPVLHALAESVRLEPSEAGTLVTYHQGVQGRPGFGWLMGQAWKKPARDLRTALEQLRGRAESIEA